MKLNKDKNEEIIKVKENTIQVMEMDGKFKDILQETHRIRTQLNDSYMDCLKVYNQDYLTFDSETKKHLGALVNNTKTLSAFFDQTVE